MSFIKRLKYALSKDKNVQKSLLFLCVIGLAVSFGTTYARNQQKIETDTVYEYAMQENIYSDYSKVSSIYVNVEDGVDLNSKDLLSFLDSQKQAIFTSLSKKEGNVHQEIYVCDFYSDDTNNICRKNFSGSAEEYVKTNVYSKYLKDDDGDSYYDPCFAVFVNSSKLDSDDTKESFVRAMLTDLDQQTLAGAAQSDEVKDLYDEYKELFLDTYGELASKDSQHFLLESLCHYYFTFDDDFRDSFPDMYSYLKENFKKPTIYGTQLHQ